MLIALADRAGVGEGAARMGGSRLVERRDLKDADVSDPVLAGDWARNERPK